MMDSDIKSCLESVDWCRADYESISEAVSHFKTMAEMPVTMLRINLVDGALTNNDCRIYSSYYEEIHKILDQRTDPTWPTTWFVPISYSIVATHLKMYIMLWQTGEQIML